MHAHAVFLAQREEVGDGHVPRQRHDLRGRHEVDQAFAHPALDLEARRRAVGERGRHAHEKRQRPFHLAREFIEPGAHLAHEFGHQRRAGSRPPLGEEDLEAVEIELEAVDEIAVALEALEHGVEPVAAHLGVREIEQVPVGRLEREGRLLDRERVAMLEPELARHRMAVGIGHEVRVVQPQARDESQSDRARGLAGGAHGIGALPQADARVLHAFLHQGARRLVGGFAPADAARDLGIIIQQVAAHADAEDQRPHGRVRERGDVRAQQRLGTRAVRHDEREIGVVVEDEAEVRARRPLRTDRDGGQQQQRQIARGAHQNSARTPTVTSVPKFW